MTKQFIRLMLMALVAALVVVIVSMLPISAMFKSILYAILLIVFIYFVSLVMRFHK